MHGLASAAGVDVLGGETMGTTWQVRLVAARSADLHALHARIEAQLARVVAQMSTWETGSDISRYNRAGPGQWQSLPVEFASVLACALEIAHASGGAFDPTVGRLVGLWGFGAQARSDCPTPSELASAQSACGWQQLRFDADSRRLLQPGGVQLDLSAIAKGFAVDLLAQTLREAGVGSALVEVGGELYGYGHKPDGTPWRVLVEAGPDEDDDTLEPCVLALTAAAVASSGDRWHQHSRNGLRYTHTLDPRSGQPLAHRQAAVSVVAASAMQADAWATALGVLGKTDGLALAEKLGLPVRYVWRDASGLQTRCSAGFQRLSGA